MKIKITEGTIIKGRGDARPGEIVNVTPGVARELFIAGKAVPYAVQPEKPSAKKAKKKNDRT